MKSGYRAGAAPGAKAGRYPSPVFGVMNMMLHDSSALSPSARLVAIAIANRLNHFPDADGKHRCWMGERDISNRTGLSVRTVRTKIHELRDAAEPIFAMRIGGVTRGRQHKCYSFELIADVQAFLAGRKAARLANPRQRRVTTSAQQNPTITPALKFVADLLAQLQSRLGFDGQSELKALMTSLRLGAAPAPLVDVDARDLVAFTLRQIATGPHALSPVTTGLRAALIRV